MNDVRCRVNTQDRVVPRFVHTNTLQEPLEQRGPQYLDVVKCGSKIINSNVLLGNVEAVREGSVETNSSIKRAYPSLFQESFVGEESLSLFLWPIYSDGTNAYKASDRRFKRDHDYFMVVNDFSVIVGVIYKPLLKPLEICESMAILKPDSNIINVNPHQTFDTES